MINLKSKLKLVFTLSFLLCINTIYAQGTPPLKGVIVDQYDEPIIGASIVIVGTTIGVLSDFDGKFSIKADVGSTLKISYIGYVEQVIELVNKEELKIVLVENTKQFEDVVVVGYGTQKKLSSIGSQSSIKNIQDLKQPVANLSTVLAGRIAGVVGMQRSGEPGQNKADIWIRGISTLSNSTPLVLVDGVERDFNDLNPEDIETFSILKDASATAVYGVRGANGVVVVTTRTGNIGKPQVRVEYTEGISNFTRIPKLADGITYMQAANEASVTRGEMPVFSAERINRTYTGEDPYLYPNVDWYKEVFKNSSRNRRLSMNVSGGSENVQYYVSLSYYNEDGMLRSRKNESYDSNSKFTRYNFNSSLNMKITSSTNLKLNVKGNMGDGNSPFVSANDIFANVFRMPAIQMPVIYPDDKVPFISTGGGLMNPLAELTRRGYKSRNETKIMSDLRLDQDLHFVTKGLSFKAMFAYDIDNMTDIERTKGYDAYWASGRDENGELIIQQQGGSASEYLDFNRHIRRLERKYYFETSLNYDRTIANDHHITGLLLFNASDRNRMQQSTLIGTLPYRSMGIAGRATYGYKSRYLAEVNFGYNGAEQFLPSKRYGFFPSYGLGWIISNEDFYEPIRKYVQLFKVRASYGEVGNSKIEIGGVENRFAYLTTVNNGNGGYVFGKNRDNKFGDGYDIDKYGVDVTWETAKKTNIGIDIELLNSDLHVSLDVFKERREGIFLNRKSVPSNVGFRGDVAGNLGITENKGYEIAADYTKRINQWNLSFKGNLSYNKNKLIENDDPAKPYPWMDARGNGINQRFGYISQGYLTEEEANNPDIAKPKGSINMAGDIKYKDLDGNGVIDDSDRTAIGKGDVPRLVFGFGATAEWKGFSFGAFFQGVGSADIFVNGSDFVPFANKLSRGNLFSNIGDRWTEENPRQDAFYPRLTMGMNNQNYAASDHWIKDGRFIRLKTLDFGYTFPKAWTEKAHIRNLRLYFLGNNLFTFSPFKLWDPELGNGTGVKYPNTRTYSLGLSFNF